MDTSPLITAFAAKATVADLMVVGLVVLLVYLLLEERKARKRDTQATADAMIKIGEAVNGLKDALVEIRITMARGER